MGKGVISWWWGMGSKERGERVGRWRERQEAQIIIKMVGKHNMPYRASDLLNRLTYYFGKLYIIVGMKYFIARIINSGTPIVGIILVSFSLNLINQVMC